MLGKELCIPQSTVAVIRRISLDIAWQISIVAVSGLVSMYMALLTNCSTAIHEYQETTVA